MHNCYDADRETAAVRLYLDESDDQIHAVLGGMLINYSFFPHFEEAWDRMLETHNIQPPLHMKEFGRPHGRFAQMDDCCRHNLFLEVAELVNYQKLASLDAAIRTSEYNQYLPERVRGKFSLYGMCFVMTVAINRRLAEAKKYQKEIAFILDTGNSKKGHVVEAHGEMMKMHKIESMNLGTLAFTDDTNLGVLQAADVIAWGARRRTSGVAFGHAFEPINKIIKEENGHFHTPFEPAWLKELGESLEAKIERMER